MSEISLGMLSAAVTDLSARVEALDGRSAGDENGSLDDLERRLRAVEGAIRKQVSTVAQNKAAGRAQVQQRLPWNKMTAKQAEQRWIDLREWVQWFVVRDNIGTKELPDCWYLHGGLVDELEALRWAWIETNRPESKMTDPLAWRESLQRARMRWPSFNPNGCTTSHTETRPRAPGGTAEWCNFLAEELAERPADRPARVG